jgi:hypothetical protein
LDLQGRLCLSIGNLQSPIADETAWIATLTYQAA